jgi:hypothetical protein
LCGVALNAIQKIKTEYTNKKSARFPASYRENRQILLFYGIIASI